MNTLTKSLVLVEDRRFLTHWGIDPIAIFRAFLVNLSEGRRAQGASTITQQLARTMYLHNRKTFSRKIAEILIAFYLEISYSKEEILGLYMSSVYMGHYRNGKSIRGFERASQHYFGKSLNDISLAEQAALVAMVKGPNFYRIKSSQGTVRRIMVLGKMLDNNIIDQNQFFEASGERL
jgi:membrane peptidoglycan carboxypeptidase